MDTNTKEPSSPDMKLEVANDTAGTHIDPVAEKKLLLKCDLHVLPPLFVLFLLAFLDRTNIGMLSYPTLPVPLLTIYEATLEFKVWKQTSTCTAVTTTLPFLLSLSRISCSKFHQILFSRRWLHQHG
jgi:hypothetical protein